MRFGSLSAQIAERVKKQILVLLHLCIGVLLLLLVPCIVVTVSGQCQLQK